MSFFRAGTLYAIAVTLAAWQLSAQTPVNAPLPAKPLVLEDPAPAGAASKAPVEKRVVEDAGGGSDEPQESATPARGSTVAPTSADTAKGEGRRNENVQVNLVDTNATRELNARVGTTATIIEEFRVDRGYFATEYGGATRDGIHIQAPAQRGPGIHGNLFWNHNNSIFSARSFFQVGGVVPARQNQYGASASMKLWKGSFFSFTGSQDKNRGAVNGNVLVPSLSERTPLATDPALRAVVQRLLDAYPLVAPNRPDIAARALNTNSPQRINSNVANGTLNQKLTAKDSLLFRYAFTSSQVNAFQFVKGQNPNTDVKSHSARITWNRVWSPSTILNVSASFDRQGTLLLPAGDAVGPVFLNGLQMLGPNSSIPVDRAQNQFRYNGTVQQRRGRHSLTFGGGISRLQNNGYDSETSRPSFKFREDFGRDLITNLRLGTPSTYSVAFGTLQRGFRNFEMQAFAGDHWAVSNKLTLYYGLRWEPWTKPTEVQGLSHLNFNSDWNNIGGDAGVAYRLPKGVVRGAFAKIQGQMFPVAYGQDRFNPPNNFAVTVQAPDMLNPLKSLSASDLIGNGRSVRFDLDPALGTPYSYQYNASWENEFVRGWKLQVGYVGSRTYGLFQTYQLNRARAVEGIPFATSTINQRRPDQAYFQRFYTENRSLAFYDAARVNLTLPRWHRATVVASYWFSKAIDEGSDYAVTGGGSERWGKAGQTETGVRKDQRGLSNFDQPHAAILQAAWDTGKGSRTWLDRIYHNWNLTSVYLLKSGTPFDVNAGSDGPGIGNADGTDGDRPSLIDPSVLGRIIGNPSTSQQLMPRSAFRFMNAPIEMAGNLGRNTFRKGKIANLNASLGRTWTLPNDRNVTLRAEAINLSNTPQFADPGSNLSSPNFGQISNTLNDGRTFRFMLRIGF